MKPIFETKKNALPISVYQTDKDMGLAAAQDAREVIQKAIEAHGQANIIIATGNSQLAFLEAVSALDGIDWAKVNIFHMDEYVGIAPNHPASFPKFLHEHIVDIVKPRNFYPVPGAAGNIEEACDEYEKLLRENPADLCVLGIGENGHLAFNDPPLARFDETRWVKVVQLTESCKRQQVGEGHFKSIDEVPKSAITLTIPALLAAKRVLAIVPEARKAEIVYQTLNGPIDPLCPASILRQTSHCHLYLDANSGARVMGLS
ncbi:MAG: glucosamine-6-phosphate deaminase [Negativicutes bacterium]|nr:glucosamine-6-phosphate deaminase [Negativicutes bacterium]